jgi:hypothetical protein
MRSHRWRTPENVWRKEPFSVTALPTIIKVNGDGVSLNQEVEKLEY